MMKNYENLKIKCVEHKSDSIIFEIDNYCFNDDYIPNNESLIMKLSEEIKTQKLVYIIKEKCNIKEELENYEYIIFDIFYENNICKWKIKFFWYGNSFIQNFDNTRKNINNNLYEIYKKIKSTNLKTDNWKDCKNNVIIMCLNDIRHYLVNFKNWENYSENEINREINYIKQNFYLDDYFDDYFIDDKNENFSDFWEDFLELLMEWLSDVEENIEYFMKILVEKIDKLFEQNIKNKNMHKKQFGYSQ